jgi:trigger factor
MQVSVQSGEGLERRITVELSAEAINQEVEKRLKEIARKVRMDGFRPGKVPVKIVRTRYASQVQQEVFGEQIQSSLPLAMTQEQLRPVSTPRIEPDIEHGQNQARFAYTAVFEVLPEIELVPLSDFTIRRPVAEVTDDDVDAMLEQLRRQRQTWQRVERPAQMGDRVLVSFTGTIDGEPFQNGQAKDLPLVLGTHTMIEGFESGLIGVSAGESRTLELRFPADYKATDLADRPVVFDVTADEVAEAVLPEMDAEFAKSFGISSGEIAALREGVRENMMRELDQRIQGKIKRQVMDALLDAHKIQLPKALVEKEIKALREQTRQELQGSGSMQLPDRLFEEQARRRAALGMIIAEVMRKHDLKLDEERVQRTIRELAASYEDPDDVVRHYNSPQHRAGVENMVIENQVVDWVLEQAQVEDVPSSFQDLTAPPA